MPIEEEEYGQIVSLGDSHIEHVRGRLAILKVRVVDLEYSYSYIKKPYSSLVWRL